METDRVKANGATKLPPFALTPQAKRSHKKKAKTPTDVSSGQERTRYINVTPKMAAEYLKHNTQNRNISRAKVLKFARAIEAGRLLTTHQGIAFDTAGILVDGQHHLLAIIETGIPVRLAVTTGLIPATRAVIDTLGGRHLHHTLQILGGHDRPMLVAAIVAAIRFAIHSYKGEAHHEDAVALIAHHKGGIDWVCTNFKTGRLFSAPVAAVFAYAFPASPKLIAEMLPAWESGAFADPKDPMLLFRNFVIGVETLQNHSARVEVFEKGLSAIHMKITGEAQKKLTSSKARIDYFRKLHND